MYCNVILTDLQGSIFDLFYDFLDNKQQRFSVREKIM